MGEFWNYVKNHAGIFIGAGVGILIAILLLTVGFWPVILIVVFGGFGAIIGGIPAVRRAFGTLFSNLFRSNKNE